MNALTVSSSGEGTLASSRDGFSSCGGVALVGGLPVIFCISPKEGLGVEKESDVSNQLVNSNSVIPCRANLRVKKVDDTGLTRFSQSSTDLERQSTILLIDAVPSLFNARKRNYFVFQGCGRWYNKWCQLNDFDEIYVATI